MLLFYLILAAQVFFLQNLLPLPAVVRLDLLTLLLIFVSLRERFIVSVSLALVIGVALDCFGLAPLGLQAGLLLLAVVGIQILRRFINFLYIFPQIIGTGIIMAMQTLAMALGLHILLPVPVIHPLMMRQSLWQIVVTALAAPIVLALFGFLEKSWRRWFFIKA